MTLALLLAALAIAQDPPVVSVGPVVSRSQVVLLPGDLKLTTCLPTVSGAERPDIGGQITLQLRVRRNRVSLVTTTQADPPTRSLGPCFERELAAVVWPVRRGRLEVPITVTDP